MTRGTSYGKIAVIINIELIIAGQELCEPGSSPIWHLRDLTSYSVRKEIKDGGGGQLDRPHD